MGWSLERKEQSTICDGVGVCFSCVYVECKTGRRPYGLHHFDSSFFSFFNWISFSISFSLDCSRHKVTTAVYQVTRPGHEHCDATEGILLDITPLVVDRRKFVTLYDKDLTEGVNLLIGTTFPVEIFIEILIHFALWICSCFRCVGSAVRAFEGNGEIGQLWWKCRMLQQRNLLLERINGECAINWRE